jgi:hypothetical protein
MALLGTASSGPSDAVALAPSATTAEAAAGRALLL